MFNFSDERLKELGADLTVSEVRQQPDLWLKTFDYYKENFNRIESFLDKACEGGAKKVKVIFTGAGTSAYVGDILERHLRLKKNRELEFFNIATTDLVSNPYLFFEKDVNTILVSFARSGNSPESMKAVDLANELVDRVYHLAITCSLEGKLNQSLKNSDKDLVLLMPEESNDKGFAMTSSFSCMLLTAILVFDNDLSNKDKEARVKEIIRLGNEVIERDEEIQAYIDENFNRVVYLGSGPLAAFSREAQLKILELTAGRITTCFDSSMGFRHGPKSFIDENTILFDFISNNEYTKLYDLDILNEVYANDIARKVVGISYGEVDGEFSKFSLVKSLELEDVFLVFPYAVFAQTVSIMASLKVKNIPDTPSATGTVNRVVKGVVIHEYRK